MNRCPFETAMFSNRRFCEGRLFQNEKAILLHPVLVLCRCSPKLQRRSICGDKPSHNKNADTTEEKKKKSLYKITHCKGPIFNFAFGPQMPKSATDLWGTYNCQDRKHPYLLLPCCVLYTKHIASDKHSLSSFI